LTNTTVLGGVSNSTTWNYTFLYNGTFYWNCRGNDTAGNSNLSTKGNFTIIYNASYVVPDTTLPGIYFISPTPANNTAQAANSVVVNISINESNLKNFTWDWNGTNYSIYDSALVLMFNFDNVSVLGEGSNNVTDDQSIYGNNGACINMSNNCNYTSGKYGNAIIFDGVKQVVNATVTQSKNSTVFWFKNSTAGSWTHVVNSSGTYYVNGTVSAVPSQYPIVINGNTVNIGMMGVGYFNGSIDEVRIYNRSLSASEALEQYYSNLNKYAIDG
jgi:hypothetical protein